MQRDINIKFPFKTPIDLYHGDIINIQSNCDSEPIEVVLIVYFFPVYDNGGIIPTHFEQLWSANDYSGNDHFEKLFTEKYEVIGNIEDIAREQRRKKQRL